MKKETLKIDGYLQLLTTSRKRIEILYLLDERPRQRPEFNDYFKVKPPEIVPRLKELTEAGLISNEEGLYKITALGKVCLKQLSQLLDTTQTLDKYSGFWMHHDLSGIPEELLERIGELKDCKTVRVERSAVFEPGALFMENVKSASNITGMAHAFFPGWVKSFVEQSNKGIPIEIVITQEIYDKLRSEYSDQLKRYLSNGSSIYIYDNLNVTCTITEKFTCILLDLKNGTFDHSNILVSNDDSLAIQWMSDLFTYYKENAFKVENNVFAISTSSIVMSDSPSRIPLETQLSVFL